MFRKLDELNSQEEKYLITLVCLLILLICSMGVMSYVGRDVVLYLDNTARAPEYSATKILVPAEGTRAIQLQKDRITGLSMQNVFINQACKFPSGSAPGNVRIENKAGNGYATQVEIVRLDNDQRIMNTGLIDPGYYVENRKLDVDLEKGEYICVAKFTMYDTLTQEVIGKASTQILVVIEA